MNNIELVIKNESTDYSCFKETEDLNQCFSLERLMFKILGLELLGDLPVEYEVVSSAGILKKTVLEENFYRDRSILMSFRDKSYPHIYSHWYAAVMSGFIQETLEDITTLLRWCDKVIVQEKFAEHYCDSFTLHREDENLFEKRYHTKSDTTNRCPACGEYIPFNDCRCDGEHKVVSLADVAELLQDNWTFCLAEKPYIYQGGR